MEWAYRYSPNDIGSITFVRPILAISVGMGRKLLIRSNHYPYHVTARANNRELFTLPLDQMWEIFGKELLLIHILYQIEIHAFVLMPNHFHLLMSVPEYDLGKVMNVLMSSVSRTVNRISNRSGHIFGGPYNWTLIDNAQYYVNALRYVYQNPRRANICKLVEDYRYSTLRGLLGSEHLPFPLYQTRTMAEHLLPAIEGQPFLEWLNRPIPPPAASLIQSGLRHKVFELIRDRNTRKKPTTLEELI